MVKNRYYYIVAWVIASLYIPFNHSHAKETITLALPIDCTIGNDCFIQNYPDAAKGKASSDYTCGFLTYPAHDGTDFRLKNLNAMHKGVHVIASASGKVRGTRDGMPDINKNNIEPQMLKGKECGNGVVIVHSGGWETQYCHLKRGSIRVKSGQQVKQGQILGQIGLSGNTEFPHVHVSVRHNGIEKDPFTGLQVEDHCKAAWKKPLATSLWDKDTQRILHYMPTALLGWGVSTQLPTDNFADIIRSGNLTWPKDLQQDTQPDALMIWAEIMGVSAGDNLVMTITAPDGTAQRFDEILPKSQAVRMAWGDKKRPILQKGTYRAHIKLIRNDSTIIQKDREFHVE